MGRAKWTQEEINTLRRLYGEFAPSNMLVSEIPNHSIEAILTKASKLGLTNQYIKKNSSNYKAQYQNYDWLYERYINKNMSDEQIANEAKCSVRTIEKWRREIHRIFRPIFRTTYHLTDLQRQVIIAGTLGDGHIDNRPDQPMYIESHAEDEKDYLFWKYNILENICNSKPTYYPAKKSSFGSDKLYKCLPYYRLNSKIVDDLYEIRKMTKIEKLEQLTDLGFCLHILDDGSRGNTWIICLAEWTQDEINKYIEICREKFELRSWQQHDKRYVTFSAYSSHEIDLLILELIPNNLDIIKKKILNNDKIKPLGNYKYVFKDNRMIGFYTYCKENRVDMKHAKIISNKFKEVITESEFSLLAKEVYDETVQ